MPFEALRVVVGSAESRPPLKLTFFSRMLLSKGIGVKGACTYVMQKYESNPRGIYFL